MTTPSEHLDRAIAESGVHTVEISVSLLGQLLNDLAKSDYDTAWRWAYSAETQMKEKSQCG